MSASFSARGIVETAKSKVKALTEGAPLPLLITLGILSEMIYLLYFVRYLPLLRYYDEPGLDLGKVIGHAPQEGLFYLGIATLLFALYSQALQAIQASQDRRVLWAIAIFGLVFSITLLFVYPWGAADLFDYAISGKVLAHYHANPFAVAGTDFPNEPWTVYAPWAGTTVAYGSVWVLLAGLAYRLAGPDLLANLVAHKIMALLFYWLAIAAIAATWQALDRQHLVAGVLFFAWNPLVLLETMANGHNDVMMIALVLVALYLFLRQRRAWSLVALAASSLIKFTSVTLAPFFILAGLYDQAGLKRKARYLRASLTAFILPIVLLMLPFWRGRDPLALGRRTRMFTTSLPTLIMAIAQLWTAQDRAMFIAQGVAAALLAAFGIYQMIQMRNSAQSLIKASFEMNFFYLAVSCSWFQPWYLVWLVGLGALCLQQPQGQRAWLFSYVGFWNYFIYGFLWFWLSPELQSLAIIQTLAMVMVIGPPLILWLWQARRGKSRRFASLPGTTKN